MMLGVRTDCWKKMVVAQRGCLKKMYEQTLPIAVAEL
jgi:hypothetical protein